MTVPYNSESTATSACSARNGSTVTNSNLDHLYHFNLPSTSNLLDGGDNDSPVGANRAVVGHSIQCAVNGPDRYWVMGTCYIGPNATAANTIIADFTGTPTSGTGPLSVAFTDTSKGLLLDAWNWTISPATGWYVEGGDLEVEDLNAYFVTNGNYTITHGVSNPITSNTTTKTDYIWVYNSTDLVTTGFLATDGTSGYPVNGAQVDLYDIENASWSNTTTIGGWATISTLSGHTINAYANATGYEDADLLAQPAKPGGFYQIYMWPDVGFKNVSEGMVTAYFHVNDANTGDPIPGALISGGGENYGVMVNSTMFGLTTNAVGMASIAVQNNTNIYITTSKGGYQTASQAFATGPGSGGTDNVVVSIMLSKLTVTPTATMTTLPGQPGVYPTTVDPYSLLSPEEKQASLAGDVLDWAPMLINLFILLTVIGGIKMIAK